MRSWRIVVCAFLFGAGAYAEHPMIDNDRVLVWNVNTAASNSVIPHSGDSIAIYLNSPPAGHKQGEVVYASPGETRLRPGEHAVIIELKDHPVPPLSNRTGYPLAFPRPHVQKLLENSRVAVWRYRWNPGEPTPMHFHDKDVVVVYLEDTALKSTTPDAKSVVNEYKANDIRFNARDRVHSELLARGTGSAIITELK